MDTINQDVTIEAERERCGATCTIDPEMPTSHRMYTERGCHRRPTRSTTDTQNATDDTPDQLQCVRCDKHLGHHRPNWPYCEFTTPDTLASFAMLMVGAVLPITITGLPTMAAAYTNAKHRAAGDITDPLGGEA